MGPAGIITGGVGYSTTPNIYVQPIFIPSSVGTSTAINNVSAEAVLDVTGSLTQIRYRSAGAGYTFNYPTVGIDSVRDPSFGEYERGMEVEGLKVEPRVLSNLGTCPMDSRLPEFIVV